MLWFLCEGSVRRRAGSCCGSALVCFLPVTSCCPTSRSSSRPRSTSRWRRTACSGCRKPCGTTWLLFHPIPVFLLASSLLFLLICAEMDPGSTLLTWWRWRPSSTRPHRFSTRFTSLTTRTRSEATRVQNVCWITETV